MGKGAFHKWKKSSKEFTEVFVEYIRKNNKELAKVVDNIELNDMKLLLGALSVLERNLNTKRACKGRKASMGLKQGNNDNKIQYG